MTDEEEEGVKVGFIPGAKTPEARAVWPDWIPDAGIRVLFIKDLTREIAPNPSNNEEEDMLLKLLFVGARGEEKTELDEYVEDDIDDEESAMDKLGTETLFGLDDIGPEEAGLLEPSLTDGATWFSTDPRPNTPLLLVPSQAA